MSEVLFALERQLLDPETRKDRAFVDTLLSPDFQEFGSSGRIYTRQEVLEALTQEASLRISADHFKASPLSDSAVLVTYISTHEDTTQCLRSSIWQSTNGQWQLLFHQGTKIA